MESPRVEHPKQAEAVGEGIYLYCIADGSHTTSLGGIGIEQQEVYTIPHQELSAVVHRCQAKAYQSEEPETVKRWVVTHQQVVDRAWQSFGTVLPLGFDTIIRGKEGSTPEHTMRGWLETEYERLKAKILELRGKAEYGVQISWDPQVIAAQITQELPEAKQMRDAMRSKAPGTAYLVEQKLKGLVRKEMERRADACFKEFYGQIRDVVEGTKIEKTKKTHDGKQMLMNLSCLTARDKVGALSQVLDGIHGRPGMSVRFTGPWPPYSFA